MNRLLSLAAAGLVFLGAWAGAVPRAAAEEIQVVKSGKYYGTLEAYRAGDEYYLGGKDAAKLFGAQLYWYAVQGQVRLTFRGRQVAFAVDSATVTVEGQETLMPRPLIIRVSQAFIPIEFFQSAAFSEVAGVDCKFNPQTKLLLVDHYSTVGPLRWFSYEDHTRVVLEVAEDLRYQTSERGRLGFALAIPNGMIEWAEKTEIRDGVVEYIHLTQESKQALLLVSLEEGNSGWRLREFKGPRRIVIDVGRAKGVAAAPASAPEAPPVPGAGSVPRAAAKAEPRPEAGPGAKPEARPETRPETRPAAGEAAKPRAAASAGVPKAALPAPVPPAAEGKAARAGDAAAAAPAGKPQRRRLRIAIDAGHGGKDGGAVGRRGIVEKTINLAASRELAGLLKEEGIFDVMLTREDDHFVKLGDRSKMANEAKADLFVSIHCNAHSSRAETGYEIYFLSERASDPDAERLAEFENSVIAMEGGHDASEDPAASLLVALARTEDINNASDLAGLIARSLGQRVDLANRGVRQAAFYVLRGANAPAVLVEMGFLSNAKDEAKLESEKYRRKIVAGIYAGVVEYSRRKGWSTEEAR
ncbi:MAG: hypothetical protein A2X36_12610 [Elusimicrobia bacterium GWA2_69_24]|nr:MAG: hypothetical protein A2X36_12610 [Elusimicrobia bacterium GWA2_69_24]